MPKPKVNKLTRLPRALWCLTICTGVVIAVLVVTNEYKECCSLVRPILLHRMTTNATKTLNFGYNVMQSWHSAIILLKSCLNTPFVVLCSPKPPQIFSQLYYSSKNRPSTEHKYRRIHQMKTAGTCLQVSPIRSMDNQGLISKLNSASD